MTGSRSEVAYRTSIDQVVVGILGLVGLCIIGLSGLAPRPDSDSVAVVFAPWTDDALARAASAGATIVATGSRPFIIIVRLDQGYAATRLRAHGALLVLDARGASGCSSRNKSAT